MKRLGAYILIALSVCFWGVAFVMAQDDGSDVVEYAGTRECRDCHRSTARAHAETVHAQTLIDVTSQEDGDENPLLADFALGSDDRMVTFPGETDARAFTGEDVAYTLGAGRHVQSYLYSSPSGEIYVFPAMWNTVDNEWQSLSLAENWPDDAYLFGQNCAGCHVQQLDVTTYEWEEDGVMCESCHGPGLLHVELADDAGGSIDDEERAAIYGAINLALDGQVCGQCHGRGLSEDGIHPYSTEYLPGQTLEDSYALADVDDEAFWWPTGHARLSYMQYNEYVSSGHVGALNMAQESENFDVACAECHSVAQKEIGRLLANEDIDPESIDYQAVIDNHPYGVTCVSCHSPHEEYEEDEPVPPAMLTDTSYSLCVTCHQDSDVTEGLHHPVKEIFEGQTIVAEVMAVASPHYTAEDGPVCTTCHMANISTSMGPRASHTFNIVSPKAAIDLEGLQDSCTTCHTEGPLALQQLIDDLQGGTRDRLVSAQEAAMNNSDTPEWVLTALAAVENEGSYGVHNYAYTNALLQSSEQALGLSQEVLTVEQVAADIDANLPDMPAAQPIEVREPPRVIVGRLTLPSVVILALAAFILIVAAFSFFRSNGR